MHNFFVVNGRITELAAYKIMRFFDNMLITPTDCNGTKCHHF